VWERESVVVRREGAWRLHRRGPAGRCAGLEAGVPSRFGREEGVEWSSFDRLSAVDAGQRPALRGVAAEGLGEGVPFRCALAQRLPTGGRRSEPLLRW